MAVLLIVCFCSGRRHPYPVSILPSCPSLPFCSSQKFSVPEEGKHRKEERNTSYLPQLAAKCISGAAVQHSVSLTVLSVQGDEVAGKCVSLEDL